jgi:hypothetical protein
VFSTGQIFQGQLQMQRQEFGNDGSPRSEFETACRGFWLAYVKMEMGERTGDTESDLAAEPFRVLFAS